MEKYRWEDSEKRRKKIKKEKVWEERRSRCAKGRKAAKHCVFPVICGSGGLKSRLAKAAGAEPAGQMRDESCTPLWREALLEVAMSKKCTPLWREAHFQVKMYKAHQVRSTFRSCDVDKVHAVVARSTCRSQNAHFEVKMQSTTCSRRFWTFRCRFA